MPFEDNGFLGSDMEGWIEKIRHDYHYFFKLAEEVNILCQRSLYELNPHNQDPQELIIACLYIRILSHYQSIIIHCERGMTPEARIILRTMFEAIFILGGIVKDNKHAIGFIKEHDAKRLKQLRKLKALTNKPENYDAKEIAQLEHELESVLIKNSIRELTTKEWASRAGLDDIYLGPYTVLSDTVHVKISDLEKYVVSDENGDIKDFKSGPDVTDIENVMTSSIEMMLLAARITLSFFKIEKTKQIDDLLSKLRELAK